MQVEQRLDEAIAETFPCSDPIAVSCIAERAAAADSRSTGATPVAPRDPKPPTDDEQECDEGG